MKILIVEDSNTLRYIMVKLLKELGYTEISAVDSAEAAIPLLQNSDYDLLLLDWKLPQLSGLDLLKQIRAVPKFASLQVIMVTTVHERKSILQAVQTGIQGYIIKPLDIKVLGKKLKEVEGTIATRGS
ncbi:MAG: response regulator [Chitinispirillaceae bacterium]|nr:response regulator [Chitinispirillaceae bacterium]